MHPNQNGLAELRGEFGFLGTERLGENALDTTALIGGVAVAGHVDETAEKLAVGIATHKQARLTSLLYAIDRAGRLEQARDARLEQLVSREQLKHADEFASVMLILVET